MITSLVLYQLFKPNALSYDQVPLNQKNWQEVDMVYWTKIHGQTYKNTIQLLRPKAYFKKYHITQIGHQLTLTLPEIGLDHTQVTITDLKPAPYFKSCQQKNCSQVIGLFKHYVTNVQTYRFKDLQTGKISMIHATPNHPFYVKNKHHFLPISEVTSTDQLVGDHNHFIKLICHNHQSYNCGINYKTSDHPSIVYNLEVYKQHNYKVGGQKILVHNCSRTEDELRAEQKQIINKVRKHYRDATHTNAFYLDDLDQESKSLARLNETVDAESLAGKLETNHLFYIEEMESERMSVSKLLDRLDEIDEELGLEKGTTKFDVDKYFPYTDKEIYQLTAGPNIKYRKLRDAIDNLSGVPDSGDIIPTQPKEASKIGFLEKPEHFNWLWSTDSSIAFWIPL